MDDTREDSKYATNYGSNQGYEDEDELEEDDEEQEQEETNVADNEINDSTQQNGDNDDGRHHEKINDNQYDDDNVDDDDDDDNDDEDNNGRSENVNMQRHPKKRKLKSLLSSYEIAPRVPPPPTASKSSFGGRNTLTDWTEHETFVLLEAWGDRFLQCGRKSLRSEEWQEVADKVSQGSKNERTDSQCRNRLDTLKKKYKKEKANLESKRNVNTKWIYFKKMDTLLSSNPISRGVNSGENNFINPNFNNSNGVEETRGSFGNSDSQDDDEDDDDDDLLPPKKSKVKGERSDGSSFKFLADSINKFCEIYEKIENNKIQQMIELERMRMDFQRDLELRKRQILDKAKNEITKVRKEDHEDNDGSAENISG